MRQLICLKKTSKKLFSTLFFQVIRISAVLKINIHILLRFTSNSDHLKMVETIGAITQYWQKRFSPVLSVFIEKLADEIREEKAAQRPRAV